jgi:hypothetical protein
MTKSDPIEAPLYVRWNAERLSFAVEIRLDLIGALAREIRAPQSLGSEIGGILFGSHPTAANPTFRIESFQLMPRRAEDGPIFMLDPREHDRFATVRWEDRSDGRTTVGFFRTHRRPGPLRPALADRALLTGEFAGQIYAALLIEATEPLTAALFVSSLGVLPDNPSLPEFRLDERAFSALPELPAPGSEPVEPIPPQVHGFPVWRYALGAVLVLVAILAGLYYWTLQSDLGKGIELMVAGDRVLNISWNHALPDMRKASSAKLTINDGPAHREVILSPDELTAGTVAYRRLSGQVQVSLILQMPGAVSVIQSANWQG